MPWTLLTLYRIITVFLTLVFRGSCDSSPSSGYSWRAPRDLATTRARRETLLRAPSSFTTRVWKESYVRNRFLGLLLLLLFAVPVVGQQDLIVGIVVHGNRRIPADTVKARIFTKVGDVYDTAAIERDFNALWNAGYFEDIRFEREQTDKGWILHIYLKERPTIREINYTGLNAVSVSDVLDRFKERKVPLSVENQYDPTKVKRAEVALKELLSEHGRQFATIRTEIRPIPPAAVGHHFCYQRGTQKSRLEGNSGPGAIKHVNDSQRCVAAMKNLKPIGIPHSIFLENIFAKTYDATKLEEDTERVRAEFQNRGYFKVLVDDPKTDIHDTGHSGFHIPWIQTRSRGSRSTSPCRLRKAIVTTSARLRSRTIKRSRTQSRLAQTFFP